LSDVYLVEGEERHRHGRVAHRPREKEVIKGGGPERKRGRGKGVNTRPIAPPKFGNESSQEIKKEGGEKGRKAFYFFTLSIREESRPMYPSTAKTVIGDR